MLRRFYVDSRIDGPNARLEGSEAHHLGHVLRVREGERVALFDGSGFEFVARVERIARSGVDLEVVDRLATDRESPRAVTLAVALPKGDRQRWLVEKAVELGVARLVPLRSERGVAEAEGGALSRLRRAVIEASKQCGRNLLMEITEARSIGDLSVDSSMPALRLLAHPSTAAMPVSALAGNDVMSVLVAVGPEGGFSEAELTDARDWHRVSLGRRILRVETAAAAIAAWFCLDDATAAGPLPVADASDTEKLR